MKSILINGLLLNGQYSGVQYSIECFIKAVSSLAHPDYSITVLVSKNYDGQLLHSENLLLKYVSFDPANRLRRVLYENYDLPKLILRNSFTLYHSPGYVLPYFYEIPSIVTIHDLIALDFPDLCKTETALYFSRILPHAIHSSKKIIAVSNTVKKDILNRFPSINPEKVHVVYHGVHSRFKREIDFDILRAIKTKYALPNKYLFFIGNIEPKKNLKKVIEAFCQLKYQYQIPHELIIAGQKGWKYSSIFDYVEKSEWKDEIRFIGYVEEEDLPSLYTLSELLLFPSLYEGFGLPVLEAMACGCPVIISDRGALPEISGGHCPQVNVNNSMEIVLYVMMVISNDSYKSKLVQQGHIWSKSFTWEESAKRALRLYDEVSREKVDSY